MFLMFFCQEKSKQIKVRLNYGRTNGCVPTCQVKSPYASYVLLSRKKQTTQSSTELRTHERVRPYLSSEKSLCFLCSFVKKKKQTNHVNGKSLCFLCSSVKIPTDIQKNPQQKHVADFFVLFITLLNVNICNVTAEGVNNHLFQKRDAVVRMRNTPFFKRV